jgi:hypothetical protein
MKDFLESVGVIILIVLVIVIVFVSISAIANPFLKISCNAETKDIGLPHRYGFWTGCQVQENSKWIPLDNWRYL